TEQAEGIGDTNIRLFRTIGNRAKIAIRGGHEGNLGSVPAHTVAEGDGDVAGGVALDIDEDDELVTDVVDAAAEGTAADHGARCGRRGNGRCDRRGDRRCRRGDHDV